MIIINSQIAATWVVQELNYGQGAVMSGKVDRSRTIVVHCVHVCPNLLECPQAVQVLVVDCQANRRRTIPILLVRVTALGSNQVANANSVVVLHSFSNGAILRLGCSKQEGAQKRAENVSGKTARQRSGRPSIHAPTPGDIKNSTTSVCPFMCASRRGL